MSFRCAAYSRVIASLQAHLHRLKRNQEPDIKGDIFQGRLIEAQFGPVRAFVMGNSDHPNHTALARKLQDYLRWRNAHARHPTCWPPSAANEPASAANAGNAGAVRNLKPHDRPGER